LRGFDIRDVSYGIIGEGRGQLPLTNPSNAGLTRVSINLEKSFSLHRVRDMISLKSAASFG
jgi:hypothetical protein